MSVPSPCSFHDANAGNTGRVGKFASGMAAHAVLALALWAQAFAVLAAPAPWYFWRSKVDGARVCAQTSPGDGWERDSAAFEGPGCHPRRKVLVIPMR